MPAPETEPFRMGPCLGSRVVALQAAEQLVEEHPWHNVDRQVENRQGILVAHFPRSRQHKCKMR